VTEENTLIQAIRKNNGMREVGEQQVDQKVYVPYRVRPLCSCRDDQPAGCLRHKDAVQESTGLFGGDRLTLVRPLPGRFGEK